MTDSPVIEVDGLTKYYGDVRGCEDVSFAVERGEVFGFLGPNGSGKSTTIRALLGLLTPTSGGATLLGRDVTDRAALLDAKADVGYIPGDVSFYENSTGERVLDYFGRLKGDDRREELLERFPIPEDRAVKEYSSGNRQKLAIVQAFMHDPALVVMDEPTSGLDPLLQNEFYDLLDEERARGVTVFFSSHILSEVRRTCDRVAIIRDGRLVALEAIDALLRKSGKVVSVDLAESPDPSVFAFEGVAQVTVEDDGSYSLILTDQYDALVDRLHDYSVRNLEIRETSLEDVFIHFYGEEGFEDDERAAEAGAPEVGQDV
ncbi:ATP-binding cassette domain-containing protein [Halobacteriaceae archaeon GCM10025711]